MSALSGSLSYSRFFVTLKGRDGTIRSAGSAADGSLPRGFLDRSYEKLLHHAMRPLDADEPDSERSGWCVLGDPLDVSLPKERVYLEGFVNLGFRTDKWVIPGAMLRARLRQAEIAYREQVGREKLSRRERAELKEVVTRELRKKLVPSTRAIDLTWSLDEGLVRFFSHTASAMLSMVDLFEKTFGAKLVAESPYTLASRLRGEDDPIALDDEALWEALTPTILVPEGDA